MTRGNLFVIDGVDGSGKKTQTKMVTDRLVAEGLRAERIGFPYYGSKCCGGVQEYLDGNLGTIEEVTAEQASLLYAQDRFGFKRPLMALLDQGINVISDRYVSSNHGHQGAKLNERAQRAALFRWIEEIEYGVFGMPRPTASFILHIPAEESMRRMQSSRKTTDLHESNLDHLKRAEETYLEIAATLPGFTLIEGFENGIALTEEQIHERVYAAIKPLLKTS